MLILFRDPTPSLSCGHLQNPGEHYSHCQHDHCHEDDESDLNIFLYPVQGCYLVKDAKVARDPTGCTTVHIQKTFTNWNQIE